MGTEDAPRRERVLGAGICHVRRPFRGGFVRELIERRLVGQVSQVGIGVVLEHRDRAIHIALADSGGETPDAAGRTEAMAFFESHDARSQRRSLVVARGAQVAEHRAGLYRRQLSRIAEQNQARPVVERFQKPDHQRHVDHRTFVHQQDVQRCVGLVHQPVKGAGNGGECTQLGHLLGECSFEKLCPHGLL